VSVHDVLVTPSTVAVAVDVGKNVIAVSATDASRRRLFGPAEVTMTAPALRALTATHRGPSWCEFRQDGAGQQPAGTEATVRTP
jgi:hypothetical protein